MAQPGFLDQPVRHPLNRLLGALSQESRERLLAQSELVIFRTREVLLPADEPAQHVFFLESGLVSLIASTKEGQAVECAAVGAEGLLGSSASVPGQSLPVEAVAQTPGSAFRLPADVFRRELAVDEELRDMSGRYMHALVVQALQSAACNRLHSLEERCARWLLAAHDRVGGEAFAVTQEALAGTLGVRRPSLTLVASLMQRAGLITYRRGEMRILDRRGLEQAACECYGVIRTHTERVLGDAREAR
jgi:CRP-like cAMP-binding protein